LSTAEAVVVESPKEDEKVLLFIIIYLFQIIISREWAAAWAVWEAWVEWEVWAV
jgi:hypothetical protein